MAAVIVFAAFVYLNNTSILADPIGTGPVLLAHRGVGQAYDLTDVTVTNETCFASLLRPPGHEYLENTIPSIEAAFTFGADIIEIDVHRTVDDQFAVFHDWTLDCRTNGSGRTRDHNLATLQTLDLGYRYTPDGGKTWPLRGRGVGLMPSLAHVLETFPEGDFLINVKSNDRDEGELLAERLVAIVAGRQGEVMVHGGPRPIGVVRERFPDMRTTTRSHVYQCLGRYIGSGWSGYVPSPCQRTVLLVPVNLAPWLWGWPNRFLQRMDDAGTLVFLVGEYWGGGITPSFDDVDRLADVPADYSGGIWTDHIERIGPAVREGLHFARAGSR